MCGIVGLVAKTDRLPFYADDLFTDLLFMDTIRGPDSTGVFGVTKQKQVDIVKGDAPGPMFVECVNYTKFKRNICSDYKVVIGHNRKATKGTISPHNAHPFRVKHITLVHNGTIHNAATLNVEAEVDSHAIAHALAEHDCVTALSKLNGAFALAWYDQNDHSLNLARNSDRPLYLVEYDDAWVISSEIGLVSWLQGREHRKHISYRLIPTDKILVIKVDNPKGGFFEVPYEQYKTWVAPVTPRSTYTTPTLLNGGKIQGSPSAGVPVAVTRKIFTEQQLKTGATLKFKLVDSKMEDNQEIIIGHPVFGDEIDENIVIRGVADPKTPIEVFLNNEFFTGRMQHYRPMGGVGVIYVDNIQPIKIIVDLSGAVTDLPEDNDPVVRTCQKCAVVIPEDKLKEGIFRKKKDNTGYRIICKECLDISRAMGANLKLVANGTSVH